MRILKSHPLLKMVNSYVIDSPQPSNISYLWNFGSLLAFCLIIQIITGVTLGMHYTPSISEAFDSVEHIMRDVNNGWLVRYLHSNTASAFFFLVYLHIGRGLYYGSYKAPRTLVWTIGTVLFIGMMATAFLGYYLSPIWSELNLRFLIENSIIVNLFIFSYIVIVTLFYLDGLKFSSNKFIKYLQIIFFTILPVILIYMISSTLNITDFICCVKDETGVNLHGHVNVTKDATIEISKGMNTIGTQWGLGATMVGVSTAVGKGIAKSGMPPLQKAGVILGCGIIGGMSHSIISAANRGAVRAENTISSNTNVDSFVNKLINDYYISPLQELLFSGEILNYTFLGLIYILIIQLIFKLYFKNSINLGLSKFLGKNLNIKIEYYFKKIIKLNKQMSIIWIWFILILLVVASGVNGYAIYNLSIDLDNFIDGHVSFNPNIVNNLYPIPNKSIVEILLNIKLYSYINIITIVILTLQILLKFYFNKNISNLYIWLTLLILILILAFISYSYGDLYSNIDSYVSNYIVLRNK